MRYDNLGGFKSIDKFVGNKIDALIKSDKSMRSLYELMFSESENVMFEETDGFRIKKTTYGQVKATVEEISPDIRRKVDSDNGNRRIYGQLSTYDSGFLGYTQSRL